jgi:hypothetical protein
MIRYPKPFKQFLKIILLCNVIIIAQHRQEQALAETAGTNQEKETGCFFQLGDKRTFIYQIIVFTTDTSEIRYAVRKRSISCHIQTMLLGLSTRTKIHIISEKQKTLHKCLNQTKKPYPVTNKTNLYASAYEAKCETR